MLLKEILKKHRVRINRTHPKSVGYYPTDSIGEIAIIEFDGAVWVSFDKGQKGVKKTSTPIYIGNLNDCDELFELVEELPRFK